MIIIFLSCQNKELSKIEYYPNGSIKKITSFQDNHRISKEITFFENGNLEHIANIVDSVLDGERLRFYESGLLESKLLFKNNLPNGVAYWFYESGTLRASRFYIDGKQYDLGFDYWDNKFVINKALVRFDNKGRVYFKLNFDSAGNPTTQEGDSLHSGVQNIK